MYDKICSDAVQCNVTASASQTVTSSLLRSVWLLRDLLRAYLLRYYTGDAARQNIQAPLLSLLILLCHWPPQHCWQYLLGYYTGERIFNVNFDKIFIAILHRRRCRTEYSSPPFSAYSTAANTLTPALTIFIGILRRGKNIQCQLWQNIASCSNSTWKHAKWGVTV